MSWLSSFCWFSLYCESCRLDNLCFIVSLNLSVAFRIISSPWMVCLAVMNFSSVQQFRYLLIVLLNLSSLSHLIFSAISIVPRLLWYELSLSSFFSNSSQYSYTAENRREYACRSRKALYLSLSSFSFSVSTKKRMSVAVSVFERARI